MVINVISINLEAKFIEGTELNLDLEPVSTPISPPLCLNVYESEHRVFNSFTVFLTVWNHLDIFCNYLVFTASYPLISLEGCQLVGI